MITGSVIIIGSICFASNYYIHLLYFYLPFLCEMWKYMFCFSCIILMCFVLSLDTDQEGRLHIS